MTIFQHRVRRERLQTNSFLAHTHLRNSAPSSRRPSSPPDDSQFSYVNRCAISDSMRTVLGTSSAGPNHSYGLGGRNHVTACTIHFPPTLREATFLPARHSNATSPPATTNP